MSRFISALYFAITISSSLFSQQITCFSSSYAGSIMKAVYRPDEPGAVILVAREGKILFRKAYGMASLELGAPMKPDMVFPLGSIVKQFTAAGILQLAQAEKLSLQDDIKKYLPDYNTQGKLITIENLLTHTSGIRSIYERPDYKNIKCNDISKDEMIKLFENEPLFFEPGKDWNYSNSGFTLAALIIEKITGLGFEDYIKKNIFEPLQMNNTYIASPGRLIPGMPPYYKLSKENGFIPGPVSSWSLFLGAGDLISCADDMLKWDEALYTEKIIRKEWLEKAWTSYILPNGEKTNYGFGWAVDEYKGLKVIQHDGIMGYLSDAVRIPEKHIYVIIISNNGSVSPNPIADDIAFHLAGKPVESGSPQYLSHKNLIEYAGTYEISRPAGNDMMNKSNERQFRFISSEGDTLYAQRSGSKKYKLQNISKDLFSFEGTATFLKFNRNNNGNIHSLELYTEPVNYGPNDIEVRTEAPATGRL